MSFIRLHTTTKWFSLLLLCCLGMSETACKDPMREEAISPCDNDPVDETGRATPWAGIEGLLLASRFETLEDLKQVVTFEYIPEPGMESSRSDSLVRLTHCSNGLQVVSLLRWGVDERDFMSARKGGWREKLATGWKSPYAIANRPFLQRIFVLSRWRQDLFSEGDPAYFDLAATMVANINTPELAYRFPRDSSEKGYLNTFNHVTAQAFITSMYSEKLADFVADVHERKAMPELISGDFRPEQLTDPNTNAVDNYVDIINNEWGQELGKTLREKYHLRTDTQWTPELLRDYLNDIQQYYARSLRIGFTAFTARDTVVVRFANKLNAVQTYFPE